MSLERLAEVVNYHPETGQFTWRVHQHRARAGSPAGHVCRHGYHRFLFEGRNYFGHRLAWLIMTGSEPVGQIDHINRVKSDNRWANLRECTPAQNSANRPGRGRRLKGTARLRWGKFQAQFVHEGRQFYLGVFDTEAEAHAAYCAKAAELAGEFASFT